MSNTTPFSILPFPRGGLYDIGGQLSKVDLAGAVGTRAGKSVDCDGQ